MFSQSSLFPKDKLDKPLKGESFNMCLWQVKKSDKILSEKFVDFISEQQGWSSDRCSMMWEGMNMGNNRFIFQLTLIVEKGLLPTPKHLEAPSASWENRKPDSNYKAGITLTDMKNWGVLPTPEDTDFEGTIELYEKLRKPILLQTPTATMIGNRSEESLNKRKEYRKSIGRNTAPAGNLAEQIFQMLPTPIAGDWKGQLRKDGTANMLSGKIAIMAKEGGNDKTQLNPEFVLEMMGFPTDWTIKPFQK